MRILFLTSRFPFPLEKGDKLRAYHLIKSLSRKADVYLFAVNDSEPQQEWIDELKPFCKAIDYAVVSKNDSAFSMLKSISKKNLPFQVAYFWKEDAMRQLKKFADKHKPDAVFCHLIRMAEYSRRLNIRVSMLDYMDTFSMGIERMEKQSNMLMKIPLNIEKSRLKKYEAAAFNWFRSHIVISEQDRNCIPHPDNSKIEVVANGVDFEYYKPQASKKKFDMLFIGNMAYPPNISSAVFAAKEIMPALLKIKPDAELIIAGANPVAKVKQLANKHIKVSGWVEDPRSLFNEARIMIAPMLISIGLQNKILQAMAMKLPCIISRLANNAIGAPENECVLVADSAADYAEKINLLLNDENLRQRIAENAYHFVKNKFSWEANTEKIFTLLEELRQK